MHCASRKVPVPPLLPAPGPYRSSRSATRSPTRARPPAATTGGEMQDKDRRPAGAASGPRPAAGFAGSAKNFASPGGGPAPSCRWSPSRRPGRQQRRDVA
ncbi:MAG: hypothetical protein AVDCRST_MAG41-3663 [uncultured Corynebacteriales bacterium]|uniref:Uncharacterized protein n=1 Tax=uncultured Mycobacteriales bacterium TaxID=581187 RepID=A0A6J4JLC7_9ACTN|nr:MAG: hypothetical protein AVDCRST_MAG41-3663 [uncultured Corynebacteriales bacterium]